MKDVIQTFGLGQRLCVQAHILMMARLNLIRHTAKGLAHDVITSVYVANLAGDPAARSK